MDKKSLGWLSLNILIALLAGVVGSFFTTPNIAIWYQSLAKPAWNPPSNWFGPVWTLLFILMGIAAYYIKQTAAPERAQKKVLMLFYIHLIFNVLWSVLFFGLHNPGLALAEIILLWFFILFLIIKFWSLNKLAAGLLIPYLLWVSFASYLNFTIWRLN